MRRGAFGPVSGSIALCGGAVLCAPSGLPHRGSPTDDSLMREFRTDEDFLKWIAEHPDFFVGNAFRPPTPSYLVLHRADCEIFSSPLRAGTRGSIHQRRSAV